MENRGQYPGRDVHPLNSSHTALLLPRAATIYAIFMDTPPLPKMTLRYGKSSPDRPYGGAFVNHNYHQTSPTSPSNLHIFTSCIRVIDNWQQPLMALLPLLGPVRDKYLLMLAWPSSPRYPDITISFDVHQVWPTRGDRRPPSFASFSATFRAMSLLGPGCF